MAPEEILSWRELIVWFGLLVTLIGAVVTAKAVILSEDDAIHIGVARYAGASREESLNLPSVQNLLKASHSARAGLLCVALGTIMQMIPASSSVVIWLLMNV